VSPGVLAGILLFGAQGPLERVKQDLAADDYHSAWARLEAEGDELTRWRGQTQVLYGAGDPAGALAAARSGLASAPDQLELLYHAAGSALWLQEVALAREYTARLERALEASAPSRTPEDQQAWRAAAADFARRATELRGHEAARVRALAQARAISVGGLAAALLLIGWAARRPPSG
jgi:hypothetical protein